MKFAILSVLFLGMNSFAVEVNCSDLVKRLEDNGLLCGEQKKYFESTTKNYEKSKEQKDSYSENIYASEATYAANALQACRIQAAFICEKK